jgi:hypothetical protein
MYMIAGQHGQASETNIPSADAVRTALERRFRTATATGPGTALIAANARAAADVAMSVFLPVLEQRDVEIERLRLMVAAWVDGTRLDRSGEETV